jgi:hypothetical protein
MRTGIENLASLMNITEKDLENLVSIIVLNNPEKIMLALKDFNIINKDSSNAITNASVNTNVINI